MSAGDPLHPVDPLHAEEVLQQVIQHPLAEREAQIDRLCGSDMALRTEVKSLLRHLPDPENLDDPEGASTEIQLEGRTVGGCRIGRLLGRGGTGRVFEGAQEWPPRPVAVKVLRPELLTEGARRRFRRETRALARLDHPGIARILAAGLHLERGIELPFVVMELVQDAQPITAWWASTRVPLQQRLAHFADLCDAVHHGHVRGLVHRDLKPSNVLVGSEGRPKVIDFGVASVTGDDGGALTLTRAVAGTPGYMAPEQFESGQAVDLRTDVHGLGLLLFECLAGRPAFARDGLTLAAAARRISDEHAPSLRSIDPGIASDLAVIVAHALAKSPSDRYASASEMGADIRRHMGGHPILARPSTPLRRARLFVKRNPVAASAIAAAAAAIVLGSAASVGFGLREARAAERAERALQQAERALWRSQLSEFGRAIETADAAMLNVLRERLASDHSWPARLLRSLSDESVASLAGKSLFENFSAMSGAISPDGSVLAVVMDQDNGVALLDPATLRHLRTLSPGHRSWAVAFDPVHGRLLSAQDQELFVWDAPWQDPPRRIRLPREYGTGVAPSPDGTRVVLTNDGNTCVVDLEAGRVVAQTDNVSGTTTRVAWSPDGSLIAVGVEPRSVRLYRAANLSEVARLPADTQRVLALDFDPSGKWLAFAGDMRRLHVVEVANLANHRTLQLDYSIWGLAWHPDGHRIAIADRGSGVRLVEVPADGSALSLIGSFMGHDAEVWCVDWSPKGDRLFSIGQTQVHAWEGAPGGGADRHELGSPGLAVASTPDGGALVLTADASVWSIGPDVRSKPIRRWSGQPFTAFVASADVAHDRFAWVSPSGSLRIARPSAGETIDREIKGLTESPSVMAFSPDGAFLAFATRSATDPLLILDATTGAEVARLPAQLAMAANGLTWRDDRTLFVGSFNSCSEVHRSADGGWRMVRSIPGCFTAALDCTPDGHVFCAQMSGIVVERDLADGHVVRDYDRLSDMAGCTALSPDGSLLAACGTDRRLHVFDRATGAQLVSLLGHQRGRRVLAVRFSASGERVISVDNGGGVAIWDARLAREPARTAITRAQ